MTKRSKLYTGFGGLLAVGTLAVGGVAANGATVATSGATVATSGSAQAGGVRLHAQLETLNNSGAFGNADVRFVGSRARVDIDAYKLLPGMPHAQHIHFSKTARHECPTASDGTNNDFRLNTTEGAPAYGAVRKSLTTRGDTSAASVLAVNRYPTAPKGVEHYNRRINFPGKALARAVKSGKGVIVIHGLDYNGNGKYDFRGAGKSDLDPSLPSEATDPAICGPLNVK